ncbi:MAG TPA: phosphotransferase family protein [Candidatus Acidoferrum sp.]|nr:phosphotransferase family protein [Candidatus Acidoferrum sp.]
MNAGETRPPRAGEELDEARLGAHLAEHLEDAAGQRAGPLVEVEQFPGGHSNLTYLLRLAGGRELVLRRPPIGSKVKAAHDMGREFRVLSRLAPAWGKAPRPLLECTDESVLGCRFYLMERLRGVILRREPPPGVTIEPDTARRMCRSLLDGMVELHGIDYAAIGLGDLGHPEGYAMRQVRGWTDRYAGSQTDDVPAVTRVATWLAENMPESGPPSLIHNDYKFDNVVLDPGDITRIIGVLDWEMATIGDPLMDLGTTLAYWVEADDPAPLVSARFGPTTLPGMMTRAEAAEHYAGRSGRSIDDIVFYFAFGLFKTAVVLQQIYYRWKQGVTRDPRFAPLIHAVGLLCERAATAIDQKSL